MDYPLTRRTFLTTSAAAGLGVVFMGARFGSAAETLQAPGRWTIHPDPLVSGAATDIEIRYLHTGSAMPPGSYHRLLIEPLSCKSFFLAQPSDGLTPRPFQGPLPELRLDKKPVNGVGFWEVKVIFPQGIDQGDSFALAYGNEQAGRIQGLVYPVPVHNITFETYSSFKAKDADGPVSVDAETPWGTIDRPEADWQRQGWAQALPHADILPGPAAALRLFVPSLVQVGASFDLRISVTDAFDSGAHPSFAGAVSLAADEGLRGLPPRLAFAANDDNHRTLTGLSIDQPGVYRVQGKLPGVHETFESNPIVVRKHVDEPIYWGNIHNHNWFSECWGDGCDQFYSFARDISGMDFVSLSDHRGSMPTPGGGVGRLLRWRRGENPDSLGEWLVSMNKANEYNDPPHFVTLYGYEWSSMDAGHYNIYLADASPETMAEIFLPRYSDYGFVMRELLGRTDALFIPHCHADVFPYLAMDEQVTNRSGNPLTPTIEFYSDWGDATHPYGVWDPQSRFGGTRAAHVRSVLWSLDNGYKLAATGDSDSHTGYPGRRFPGGLAPHHCHPQGLTAVRTDDFSRQGIMDGYWNMKTYATTGERVFLDVRAGSVKMGETLRCDDPFDIDVEVAGTDAMRSITLYDGLGEVAQQDLAGGREGKVTFNALAPTDVERPYLVAVVQEDENRAWSTPIWVRKASLPELQWQRDGGDLYLANIGAAPVNDLEVLCADDEHPYVVSLIPGRECGWNEEAGFVWLEHRTDRRAVFHYRWHGPPLQARCTIAGARDYLLEGNRHFIFLGGKTDDNGKGNISFQTGKETNQALSRGFDIRIDVRPDVPCSVRFDFETDLTTLVGPETVTARTVTVPINGRRTDKPLPIETIPPLSPNQRWRAPAGHAFYGVDPYQRIKHLNQDRELMADLR